MKNITHLIFSGNAMRSICLLGIIRYLYCYNLHHNIKFVTGTSMGSFFGLAFSLKIPFEDLENYVKKITLDDSIMYIKKEDFGNLILNNGMDKTINYLKFFKEFIKKKYDIEDITFIDFAKKTGIDFNVSVTNVNTYENEILNLTNTPNVSVFDAVSASMTLPFISQPVLINGYYYIDGGLSNNFPIKLYDKIPKENILGVIVDINDYTDYIDKDSNINFYQYSLRIIQLLIKNTTFILQKSNIKDNDNENILFIHESPVDSINLNFNKNNIHKILSSEDIDKLIFQGYKDMFNYMKKYE